MVALETSCGREGALCIECDVDGRELRYPSCGRGGNGGGVPSREGDERPLVDVLRDMLFIMFSVGFAKSCCSPLSAFLEEALLLFCVGVVGALCEGEAAPSDAALPVSGIKTVVAVPHRGNTQRGGIGSIVDMCMWGCIDMRDGNHGSWQLRLVHALRTCLMTSRLVSSHSCNHPAVDT